MKLYSDKSAVNPRRVRIYLAEKGLADAVEIVEISINERETEAESFRNKNPLGWLPVLETGDGETIAESMAICRYFEALHPEPALFGVGAIGIARVEQWNRHLEHEILLPSVNAFRNGHDFWRGRIEQAPAFAEMSVSLLRRRLKWLDGVLAERPFVAGSEFSVADITALCAVDFAKLSKVRVDAAQANVARWYAAMRTRPSYSA